MRKFSGMLAVIGLVLSSVAATMGQDRMKMGQHRMKMGQDRMKMGQDHRQHRGISPESKQVRRVRDLSWIFIDAPEPHEIKVHDIVTIIVDEKSEVTLNSRFNRQRSANLKAELKEFIRIDEDGNLAGAAKNEPTVDANLQGRMQTTGKLTDQEGIRYRIAATVVDVLPNGNVVLEARKSIRSNRDVWQYSLTGVIRSADISSNNTARSENIANLNIVKRQRGKVYDSTKRPWGIVLYDWLSPF